MFIATLIADALAPGDLAEAADRLAAAGCLPGQWRWIDEGAAADLIFESGARSARIALEGAIAGTDVIIQLQASRAKRLLVSDMDSTMITVECIDELADYAGLKAEVAAVTERAMRGELDFEEALEARVSLLKGMPVSLLASCLNDRVVIMPGARALVRTMRAAGGQTVLVSGGFTHFADPVAAMIGFDHAISNRLGIKDNALDGTVERPVIGAAAKREALLAAQMRGGLTDAETLAVGDGANDISMIEAAGLGIAYHAKERVAAAAAATILHGDLTTLLYAQGIRRADWAEES